MKQIIYYTDELNDEFSRAKIKPKIIDKNYNYHHQNIIWNFCSFVMQNILSMPIKVAYSKIKFHIKYVRQRKIKTI